MKYLTICLFSILLLTGFSSESLKPVPGLRIRSFGTGEIIDYRINFGIFTVGHASTKVEKEIFNINQKPCYKIEGHGSTSGMVAWFSKVDNEYGAYVDTSTLVTLVSYRNIKEGDYRKNEVVNFDHENKRAEVKIKNRKTGLYDDIRYYPVKEGVRDIVAGFTYLRVMDLTKSKKGDTLSISGFFEDASYVLKILYDGKEKISSAVGKIVCHRLVPIVPDNKLFDGKNAITIWLSNDENQIPIRIQAKMFIGSTGLEMEKFRGLRNQLKIVQ